MSQDSDRRFEPRTPIELKVEYKRLNTFFYDYTKNISRGGTFIKTEKPLPNGTLFLFKLFVPTLEGPLVLHGEVRWVVAVGGHRPDQEAPSEEAGMGIRFVYEDERQRNDVEQTVEKLMVSQLGTVIFEHLKSERED